MGLAIICPGQGSQTATMFALLQKRTEAVKILDEASQQLGFDLDPIQDSCAIHLNRIAQPLLCAYMLATWQVLEPLLKEQKPMLFLGYSVGEICAHILAGSISKQDALALCAKRAQLMDASAGSPQAMAAVRGLPRSDVDALCDAYQTEIAIINGPLHYVLGGRAKAVETLCGHVETHLPGQVRRLRVTVASHTSLLASAAHAFSEVLANIEINKPLVPVLAGIDGSPVRQPDEVRRALVMQLSNPLQWECCLLTARERGATCFLELGPGNAMAQIARELLPDVPVRSIADFRSLEGAATWVQSHAKCR